MAVGCGKGSVSLISAVEGETLWSVETGAKVFLDPSGPIRSVSTSRHSTKYRPSGRGANLGRALDEFTLGELVGSG